MEAVLNVALPIFAIIALGFAAGHWKVLGEDSANALNRYVFFFALPPAMFIFSARAEISQILNWPFIGAFLLAALPTAAVATLAARVLFGADRRRAAFHGFIAVFANYGYMGIPIFLTAFGSEGVLPAIVLSLVGGILAMIYIMVTLEVMQAGFATAFHLVRAISRIFVRNPLFLATVLGVAFSYYSIPVPVAAGNLLEMLALTAGPTALFALGLSLVGHPVLGNLREVAWLVALKLVAQPLATWLVIRQFPEIDPFWSMSAVVLAAMPLGSTAYVLAQQYGVAVRVTSATVALSTACSIVTLTALIVLFGVD